MWFLQYFKSRRVQYAGVVFGALFLLFCFADYYMENVGLPRETAAKIVRHFSGGNADFTCRGIRFGVVNGLVLDQVKYVGRGNQIQFEASALKFKISPLLFFRGILLPLELSVEVGYLSLPVFPEYGREAFGENLEIYNLSAKVVGTRGVLQVSDASGEVNGIKIRMEGTFDNLLHFSGSKLAQYLQHFFSEKKQVPSKTGGVYFDLVKSVPLEFRRRWMRFSERIANRNFSKSPECDIEFELDVRNFSKCRAVLEVRLPSFRYGNLQVGSIRERLQLKDAILYVDDVQLGLGQGGWIQVGGRYDGNGDVARGRISGECRAGDLLLFLDESLRSGVLNRVDFCGKVVKFEGELENFSMSDGIYTGSLNVEIPEMKIDDVSMKNSRLELRAGDSSVTGRILSAELPGGGYLSGTFVVRDGKFSSQFEGAALPSTLRSVLSSELRQTLDDHTKFQNSGSLIEFSGKLESVDRGALRFNGRFDIMLPSVELKGIPFDRLTATVAFTPEEFRIVGMNARLADGSRFSGDVLCIPNQKTVSAALVCSGAPSRIIRTLGPEHRQFLESLTHEIKWPSSGDIVEVAVEIHGDYGERPYFRLNGSIVMKDFSYRDIAFRYGAARFVLSPENVLILPNVVLETENGHLSMKAVYKPDLSGNRNLTDLFGVLDFSLNSTMKGNSLIRLLYPEWKSEFIDFPFLTHVEAKGSLNSTAPEKSFFESKIMNGSCVWNQIRIDDLDTKLDYRDETLSFKDAGGVVSGGRLKVDYRYSFRKEAGRMSLHFSGAELDGILKQLKFDGVHSNVIRGRVSGNMESSLSYNSKEELLMNGNGKITVVGDDLWTVPMLGGLLKFIGGVWSLDSLGAITKVLCDFQLENDTMKIVRLKSDGGVVSLGASGTYRWQTNEFDLVFRAELLKNALPFDTMSRLLTPVSWILSKRLKGKFSTYQWE